MKGITITFLLFILILVNANAAMNGLSIHSRANCGGFNESITWDARWYRTYATTSDHFYNGKFIHEIQLPWQDTWRSAAFHVNEGYNGWQVIGTHWMLDEKSKKPLFLGSTNTVNCDIYNGWWNF